jgi:hypothetical protein
MKKIAVLFSASILLIGSMFGILATNPPAHGQFTGTVCLISPGTTSCPSSPASITGSVGSQLRVSVFIQNSDGLNGFDVTLLADHTILKPAGADLTGTVLPGPQTVLVECLSGMLIVGNVCSSTDSIDTLHFAAVGAPGIITNTPTTGLLFTAIYNITGLTSGIPLGFQTGCSPSSVSGTTICVDIANGSIHPDPEIVQTAVFTTTGDFSIVANPVTLTIPRGASGTSTITLMSLGGFSGTVTLSTSLTPSVHHGPAASLSSNSVTIASGGSGSVVLTVSALKNTPTGSYSVMVVGTSGTISHSVNVSITITR